MSRFYIEFDGRASEAEPVDFDTVELARDEAIVRLGAYLQSDPSYAYQRHWRIDLRDHAHRLILHVIVATVEAPSPINLASYGDPAR